jgi:hypothetical protein
MSTRARQTAKRPSYRCDDHKNQVSTRNTSQRSRERSRLNSELGNPGPANQFNQGFGQGEGRDEGCGHQMVGDRQGNAQVQMVDDRGVLPLGDATNLTPRKRQRLGGAKPDLGETGEVQMHAWGCFKQIEMHRFC